MKLIYMILIWDALVLTGVLYNQKNINSKGGE